MGMELRKTPLTEREEEILRLHRAERKTYEQIGSQFGLSRERIRQICRGAKERLEDHDANGNDAMSILPKLARTVLGYVDIFTKEQVREAVESGRLWWDDSGAGKLKWGKSHLRNGGWKTWISIQDWLGIPRTVRKVRSKTLPP
jgi:DNA-binding CsgD family transcriptional regulator